MRTNIEIDDGLMAAALAAGPFKTKKAAVEAGLRLLQKQAAAAELLKLEGQVDWGWGDEERLDGQPNIVPAPGALAAKAAKPSGNATKAKVSKQGSKRARR